MELLPNEVIAQIYARLPVCSKLLFSSTCRAYRSFASEGFPAFARAFSQVVAEINNIAYSIPSKASKPTSVRKYKGKCANYSDGRGHVNVFQFVAKEEATRAQARRYTALTRNWANIRTLWDDSGLTTSITICGGLFGVGINTPGEYRVNYILTDELL
jgi:hypothetical protein